MTPPFGTPTNLPVWGIDGRLEGNDDRLFLVAPAIDVETGIAVVDNFDWEIATLHRSLSYELAERTLTAITTTPQFTINEGDMVLVGGPAFRDNMNLTLGPLTESELVSLLDHQEVLDGYQFLSISRSKYVRLTRRLAELAQSVFATEIGRSADFVSHRATAAYYLLRDNVNVPEDEMLILSGLFHRARRDERRFSLVLLRAETLGLDPAELEKRIEDRQERLLRWSSARKYLPQQIADLESSTAATKNEINRLSHSVRKQATDLIGQQLELELLKDRLDRNILVGPNASTESLSPELVYRVLLRISEAQDVREPAESRDLRGLHFIRSLHGAKRVKPAESNESNEAAAGRGHSPFADSGREVARFERSS